MDADPLKEATVNDNEIYGICPCGNADHPKEDFPSAETIRNG